jgi:hypothetical protein
MAQTSQRCCFLGRGDARDVRSDSVKCVAVHAVRPDLLQAGTRAKRGAI